MLFTSPCQLIEIMEKRSHPKEFPSPTYAYKTDDYTAFYPIFLLNFLQDLHFHSYCQLQKPATTY